ncbi:hypothetical protein H5410_052323 [Solanum commersonii]|uniref:Uncharacterized protein n=1 Tax=Solanum commersonii TaxID=4109 RepID=A0A9J5X3R0_SOLCO|nr:hypothetical protein H5410_052323 [Solanum commersonii]
MDDSSPFMRITRGTPLHVKVVDNPLSFSIGLTHNFGVNAVIKIVKASGIKIVEGGSKRKSINSDSKDIESASSDLDKHEEY